MKKLHIDTPEQLTYGNGLLILTVLGGVRLEGLDRLRVTLKIELPDSPQPPLRHNLDLYNDNQVEKLVRKVAERLEIGTSIIAASLSELTQELEAYRLQEIKAQQATEPQARPLTPGEKDAAQEHLQAANLMEQTLQDLQATGIQGEQYNSMVLFLAMTSRKCHDPLSVICLANSGMGKSYLMEKVANCLPDEDKREHTQFTGNSFYYYKREEIRGKVFLIEDLDGAQEVLFPIRELQTKKRISKTVTIKDKQGQLRTVTLVVEGPVSVIGCTTREKVYEDNANRSILIYLDGSKEQDARIMTYQKQLRAGQVNDTLEKATVQKLQNMQKLLQPVRVINPYAPLIEMPQELFKPRRTLPLLLSFIEAITFYNQQQRPLQAEPSTAEVYIETTPQDWKAVHEGGWESLQSGKTWAHIGVATAQGTVIGLSQGLSLVASTAIAGVTAAEASLVDDAIDKKPLDKKALERAALKGVISSGGNLIFNRFGLANDQHVEPFKSMIGVEVNALNSLIGGVTDRIVDGYQEGFMDKDGTYGIIYHRGRFDNKPTNKSHDKKGDRKQRRVEKHNEHKASKAFSRNAQ